MFPLSSRYEDVFMEEMVFATFLKLLKETWNEVISEADLIQLLYDGVTKPAELVNNCGDDIWIKKSTANNVFKRTNGGNVRRDIRVAANDPRVVVSIQGYFQKNIVNHILPSRKADLVGSLRRTIEKDDAVQDKKRRHNAPDTGSVATKSASVERVAGQIQTYR